jgi:anti-anti-sigma factor
MKVKIDTREKFHVIKIEEPVLAANMTADLENCLLPLLESSIKNLVLNCQDIETMELAAAETIVRLQQSFYENEASFVICGLNKDIENELDNSNLLELLNITPTESEAWDIVQMEEIERELLGD